MIFENLVESRDTSDQSKAQGVIPVHFNHQTSKITFPPLQRARPKAKLDRVLRGATSSWAFVPQAKSERERVTFLYSSRDYGNPACLAKLDLPSRTVFRFGDAFRRGPLRSCREVRSAG